VVAVAPVGAAGLASAEGVSSWKVVEKDYDNQVGPHTQRRSKS
jgi:hypothetical protein